ncbi:hypothetical protein BGZ54_003928 [Gamsiella multidivaricata]|nr:hypothetical protein BGZ54_003928 [Gamsiella multidivaricata]
MVTNHQEELMLTRRQKTLSSIISNYIPLHIILNRPTGVSFSITVPKSLTIEQLARQIEAEYAFLVERELGTSRYPVIECGALFDHVELPPRQRRRRWTTTIENGGGGDGKDVEVILIMGG